MIDRPRGAGWRRALACLALAAGVAPAARADPSDPVPVPDARVLGTSDALVAYCAKADPASEQDNRDHVGTLVRGVPAAELGRLRNGDAYKAAYDSMIQFLARVDEHNAKIACSRNAAGASLAASARKKG